MRHLATETDRKRVAAWAKQRARLTGVTGTPARLLASKLELDFWERWRVAGARRALDNIWESAKLPSSLSPLQGEILHESHD